MQKSTSNCNDSGTSDGKKALAIAIAIASGNDIDNEGVSTCRQKLTTEKWEERKMRGSIVVNARVKIGDLVAWIKWAEEKGVIINSASQALGLALSAIVREKGLEEVEAHAAWKELEVRGFVRKGMLRATYVKMLASASASADHEVEQKEQENPIKTIKDLLGLEVRDLTEMIREMEKDELIKLVEKDEFSSVSHALAEMFNGFKRYEETDSDTWQKGLRAFATVMEKLVHTKLSLVANDE